jgi:hypothetical protein
MLAAADAVEPVAGSYHPGIVRGTLQVFAEVLEDGWIRRRHARKVIQRLIGPGGERRGCDVVAEDPTIHHLGKERSLRDKLGEHSRDVFLAFRSEGLFVPRASAKGHDDGLLPVLNLHRAQRGETVQRACGRCADGSP